MFQNARSPLAGAAKLSGQEVPQNGDPSDGRVPAPGSSRLSGRADEERNRSSEVRADIRKLDSHAGVRQNMSHDTLPSQHHT